MDRLLRIWRLLTFFFRRDKMDQELAEEMRLHLEMKAEEKKQAGLEEIEAQQAATREFGNPLLLREVSREMWGWAGVESIVKDVRYGLRMLAKNPGFTAVAVLTLALGIGANIAIFNLIDSILIHPLHIKEPHRLVELVHGPFRTYDAFLYTEYLNFKETAGVFSSLAAYGSGIGQIYFNDGRETVTVPPLYVSNNYFATLVVIPQRGRFFFPFECKNIGTAPVLVLSGRFWKSHFPSAANVIGKTVKLNNLSFTIVGIAPDDFRGLNLSYEPAVFIPLTMAESLCPLANLYSDQVRNQSSPTNWLLLAGRLFPHVNQEKAAAILTTAARRAYSFAPEYAQNLVIETRPFSAITISSGGYKDLKRFLFMLAGVVGFTLLIACASVANLLLARAEQRRKEMAVRLSLGAGNFRLMRQLLMESLMLSIAGGAAGLLIMFWLINVLSSFSLPGGIRIESLGLGLNWTVLIFTAGLTLLTTLIFGMAPAWKTSRVDLLSALKTQGVATGRGKSRLRNMLSIVEIALCLPLLVGTGLFVRSMQRVLSTNLGYDPKNLMAQHFDLISWHYSNLRSALFFQDLLDRVREMPGVVSASVIRSSFGTPSVLIEGVEKRASQITWVNVVDRQYFETMRIPIVQGRGLTESDVRGAAKVAIINGAMARLFWPGQNPIGQRIAVPPAVDESNPVEIVGVAGSIREFGPQGKTHSQIYLPQRQFDQSQIPESADINGDLIIRTTGLTTGIAASLRGAIQTIAPGLPFQTLKTAEAETWSSMAIQRFGATLLGLLGLLGVVLATVGIYGLIAYSVCQRTNEIGIRMAMGADREQILRLFLHDGAALILCGVGFGVGAAILTVRLLTNFLFDVKPHDFATFLGVGILLAGVAFVASYLSARRATQLDPVSALREE